MSELLTKEKAIAIHEVNGEPTMSSLRIAEVTEKEHKHVIRDIKNTFAECEIDESKYGHIYLDKRNRRQKHYLLLEREFNLVVSGYSAKYRLQLIDELMEHRDKAKHPSFDIPKTFSEALLLAGDTMKKNELLELENKQKNEVIVNKDKVILAVADLNIKSGEVTIGDLAKNLAIKGLGQNNLFKWLKGRGFLMLNTSPYQQYVERGYFTRKPSSEKINGKYRYTTYVTPRGTTWIAKMLRAEFELDSSTPVTT